MRKGYKGDMKHTGILLIHGLMGSPREFHPVARRLEAEGYLARTITLPGHGFNPFKPFHETSPEELWEHCLREYDAMAPFVDEVVIVGHSLGGICTLLTASEQPRKLKGVITFSTPYEHAYLYNHVTGLLNLPVTHLVRGVTYIPECSTGFERPQFHPRHLPKLRQEAVRTLENVRHRIPRIEVPLCLAHSKYDLTIPYQEMMKIAQSVRHPDKVITHTLEQSGHQIFPHSRDYDRAIEIIRNFIAYECEQLSLSKSDIVQSGLSA